MGYENPLMKLPAMRQVMALPVEQRRALEALMRELRADADTLAEKSWAARKGPMASYWRAVSTYARHVAHALSKGPKAVDAEVGQRREDQSLSPPKGANEKLVCRNN